MCWAGSVTRPGVVSWLIGDAEDTGHHRQWGTSNTGCNIPHHASRGKPKFWHQFCSSLVCGWRQLVVETASYCTPYVILIITAMKSWYKLLSLDICNAPRSWAASRCRSGHMMYVKLNTAGAVSTTDRPCGCAQQFTTTVNLWRLICALEWLWFT